MDCLVDGVLGTISEPPSCSLKIKLSEVISLSLPCRSGRLACSAPPVTPMRMLMQIKVAPTSIRPVGFSLFSI